MLNSCDYNTFPKGKRIYESNCSFCHMESGKGLGTMYPSLHESTYLSSKLSELPCIILSGKKGQVLETVNMPPVSLDETDMINLISYLNYQFGSNQILKVNELKTAMQKCLN